MCSLFLNGPHGAKLAGDALCGRDELSNAIPAEMFRDGFITVHFSGNEKAGSRVRPASSASLAVFVPSSAPLGSHTAQCRKL